MIRALDRDSILDSPLSVGQLDQILSFLCIHVQGAGRMLSCIEAKALPRLRFFNTSFRPTQLVVRSWLLLASSAAAVVSVTNCHKSRKEGNCWWTSRSLQHHADTACIPPEPKMAWACLFWTSLGTTMAMSIFGSIACKQVLASSCLLVSIPSLSTYLLTEIHGRYFSQINSLMRCGCPVAGLML